MVSHQHGHPRSISGTDNHLVLMNLRPQKITGSKVEKMCDRIHITVNKNSVVGDKSAITPGGVRLGACAMTTRGLVEKDFKQIGEFLHRGIQECMFMEGYTQVWFEKEQDDINPRETRETTYCSLPFLFCRFVTPHMLAVKATAISAQHLNCMLMLC